ncbi:32122_t:CDS:2, partial [Racocetra persica]
KKGNRELEFYQKGFLVAEKPLLAALILLDIVQESGIPNYFINPELKNNLQKTELGSICKLEQKLINTCKSIDDKEDS